MALPLQIDDLIIISIKFRNEIKLISVDRSANFEEYVGKVVGKFPILRDLPFSSMCTVGGISDFSIVCEDDFCNMLLVCIHSGSKIAKVELCIVDDSGIVYGGQCNGIRGHGFRSCEDNISKGSSCVDDTVFGSEDARIRGIGSEMGSMQDRAGGVGGNIFVGGGGGGETSGVEGSNAIPEVSNVPENVGVDLNKPYSPPSKRKRKRKGAASYVNNGKSVEFCGKFGVPSYDVCPPQKKVSLLSDQWANIMVDRVGTVFKGGAKEFRKELIKYTSKMGFKFKYVRNDPKYVYAECSEAVDSGCEWFIKAKRQPVTLAFEVYKAEFTHKCVGKLVNDDAGRLGAAIWGDLVMSSVKSKPGITSKDIKIMVKESYGIDLTYSQAWRTIEFARDKIFGTYDESYDQLRWYCRAIERTNPGSVVALEANHEKMNFERVFIAFKACIDGFRMCRPMLFIDGTFMKGRARGTMLTATAKDGDNGLFPVAFAIVSAENKDNWIWFLQKLRDHIGHDKQVFYISDRNSGLMEAFPFVFKDPVHFYCLFHLLTNLKGRFGKGWTAINREKLCVYFTEAAYAPNKRIFEDKLNKFIEEGGDVSHGMLKELPFEKWAVAYSPHITRYGEMTSNAAESFNSWIRESRCLPVTYMIDDIRLKLSGWYVERRKIAASWTGALCASKEEMWNSLSEIGRPWSVILGPHGDYQVTSTPSVRVDLRTKQCSCYQWQIKGFPCAHGVAVIRKTSKTVFSFIEECFHADQYRECYHSDIHQIPETDRYECENTGVNENMILPPILKRPPGRPKKVRITSYGEFPKRKSKKVRVCDRCGKIGKHDSITCSIVPESDDPVGSTASSP